MTQDDGMVTFDGPQIAEVDAGGSAPTPPGNPPTIAFRLAILFTLASADLWICGRATIAFIATILAATLWGAWIRRSYLARSNPSRSIRALEESRADPAVLDFGGAPVRPVRIDEQGRIFAMSGGRLEMPGLEPEAILQGLADADSGQLVPLDRIAADRA